MLFLTFSCLFDIYFYSILYYHIRYCYFILAPNVVLRENCLCLWAAGQLLFIRKRLWLHLKIPKNRKKRWSSVADDARTDRVVQFCRERLFKPNIIVVHQIQDLVNRPFGNKILQILDAFLFTYIRRFRMKISNKLQTSLHLIRYDLRWVGDGRLAPSFVRKTQDRLSKIINRFSLIMAPNVVLW